MFVLGGSVQSWRFLIYGDKAHGIQRQALGFSLAGGRRASPLSTWNHVPFVVQLVVLCTIARSSTAWIRLLASRHLQDRPIVVTADKEWSDTSIIHDENSTLCGSLKQAAYLVRPQPTCMQKYRTLSRSPDASRVRRLFSRMRRGGLQLLRTSVADTVTQRCRVWGMFFSILVALEAHILARCHHAT